MKRLEQNFLRGSGWEELDQNISLSLDVQANRTLTLTTFFIVSSMILSACGGEEIKPHVDLDKCDAKITLVNETNGETIWVAKDCHNETGIGLSSNAKIVFADNNDVGLEDGDVTVQTLQDKVIEVSWKPTWVNKTDHQPTN